MRNSNREVWPRILKATCTFLLLITTCFAQKPVSTPAIQTSSPGYLDPLPQDTGSAGLKQELRKLQTTGRLMMVTAHPDDEYSGLLTLESRGIGEHTLRLYIIPRTIA